MSTTGYVPVNGLNMYYEIHGSGTNEPLVLLHGSFMTISNNWSGWIGEIHGDLRPRSESRLAVLPNTPHVTLMDCFTDDHFVLAGVRNVPAKPQRINRAPNRGSDRYGSHFRINGQINEMYVVNVECPVEPFEDGIVFAQHGMDERQRVRRHVARA